MDIIDAVFLIAVIIMSAVIHEVMHGVAADKLGDPTARYAGRLTLNPIPHLDMFGSILLPIILAFTNAGFLFAWAKPVPYNPYNLRAKHWGEAIVAGAGPASNLVIALIGGLLLQSGLVAEIGDVVFLIVVVNVMLFIFNLIPIPPLDGSKVLEALLPGPLASGYREWRSRMEMNPFLGLGLVLIFVFMFGGQLSAFVYGIAQGISGI